MALNILLVAVLILFYNILIFSIHRGSCCLSVNFCYSYIRIFNSFKSLVFPFCKLINNFFSFYESFKPTMLFIASCILDIFDLLDRTDFWEQTDILDFLLACDILDPLDMTLIALLARLLTRAPFPQSKVTDLLAALFGFLYLGPPCASWSSLSNRKNYCWKSFNFFFFRK